MYIICCQISHGFGVHSLMGLGGWSILNIWLSDSKKAQNVALLIQLMQVRGITSQCHHVMQFLTGIDTATGHCRMFETSRYFVVLVYIETSFKLAE